MGLPEKGTTDQLRVIIEGKLTEMTLDDHKVQVCLEERGGEVMLRNADGVFVTAEPEMTLETASGVGGMGDGSVHGVGTCVCSGAGGPDSDGETTEKQLAEALSQNQTLSETVDALCTEMSDLATGFDDMLTAKEEEVKDLKARILELETSRGSEAHTLPASVVPSAHSPRSPSTHVPPSGKTAILRTTSSIHSCRGKAPPVSEFTGEDPEYQLDDWLPTLERACTWNSWTEEEKLIQLACKARPRR